MRGSPGVCRRSLAGQAADGAEPSPGLSSTLNQTVLDPTLGETLGVAAATHLVLRLEDDDEVLVLRAQIVTGLALDLAIEEVDARVDDWTEEIAGSSHAHTVGVARMSVEPRGDREKRGEVGR
jgi:hypothetical protein